MNQETSFKIAPIKPLVSFDVLDRILAIPETTVP
jgi:hypothetical protein